MPRKSRKCFNTLLAEYIYNNLDGKPVFASASMEKGKSAVLLLSFCKRASKFELYTDVHAQ